MSTVLALINRLLPFATPGTPLLQDLLHLGALCALLYYAPRLQEWAQRRNLPDDDVAVNGLNEAVPEDGLDDSDNDVHDPRAVEGPDIIEQNIRFAEDAQARHAPPAAPQVNDVNEEAPPGPANVPNTEAQRNVGAKKAKSLARKDQKRAYHEFQRSQGEAQRARDAEGAAEREAGLAAERERRQATEAALEAKKAKERETKRERERKEREDEVRRRNLVIGTVRRELDDSKVCDLWKVAKVVGGDVDEEWVEKILDVAGMIGMRNGVMTMITEMGWAVRVTGADMAKLYETAVAGSKQDGVVEYEELGPLLESIIRNPS